jgi:succinoglycan biosynthesis protein ExoM
MNPTVAIQVCVLTYKRPEMLRNALASLRAQVLSSPRVKMHLLVVDNDAAGSGQATFESALEGSPFPARYICEPTRGISNARNRALLESTGMDYIAFIDDDEVATSRWLHELYTTLQQTQADIVTGPVTPEFLAAPQWIVQGRRAIPSISSRPPMSSSVPRWWESTSSIVDSMLPGAKILTSSCA